MKKLFFSLATLLVTMSSLIVNSVSAESITLQNGLNGYVGVTDAFTIMKLSTKTGSWDSLEVQGYHCTACIDKRALIRFELSTINTTAKITKATLSLYEKGQARKGGSTVNIHTVTRSWNENEASWYNATTADKWTTAAGDFEATPVATYNYDTALTGWHAADITSMVQKWAKDPTKNFGMLLYMVPTMLTVQYHSSQYKDPSLRPKLTIDGDNLTPILPEQSVTQGSVSLQVTNKEIHFSSLIGGSAFLTLYSPSGRVLLHQTLKADRGENRALLPSNIHGINILSLKTADGVTKSITIRP